MILAIEASSPQGSIAVVENGACLFAESFTSERGHSAGIFLCLERVYAQYAALNEIVVGLGPGSYSGVRIAIAAALGLGAGRPVGLYGISSVAAMETDATEYLVIGDARRGAFYFSHVAKRLCVEGPMLVEEEALRGKLDALKGVPVYATGTVPGVDGVEIRFLSAAILGELGEKKIGIAATGMLEPIYLRDPHITKAKPRIGVGPRRHG
jgi:tRNA threonylcarbamoyl adenosine modification protein YeaZ